MHQLHDIFEKIVVQSPSQEAVQYENNEPFTYKSLDELANQLARHLTAKGIKTQSFVLVQLKRSVEQVAVLLALSKIGAIYIPISTEQSSARLHQIQKDCRAAHIITTSDLLAVREAKALGLYGIFLDKEKPDIVGQSVFKPEFKGISTHVAYVAYSSGTTGEPKGIPIIHAGLGQWAIDLRLNIKHPVKRVLGNTSIDFDAHIWDYLMAWTFGAALHLTSEETRKDADKLAEFIITHHISDMTLTPAVLRAFSDKQIKDFSEKGLKAIYSTGEACTKDIITRYLKESIKIYNCYGPTEATFGLSMLLCTLANFHQDSAPIGMPTRESKIQIAIVDESGKEVKEGQAGRLVIKSPYVTKGYLNKTSDKITQEINSDGEKIQCFETDDKFFKIGNHLYCMGRINHTALVKIRGQLVDVSGIENILRRFPLNKINDAYVIVRSDLGKDVVLTAFVVCEQTFKIDAIREHCIRSGLIPASIPTYFVRLSSKEVPLTIAGKVNRDALVTKKFVFSRDSAVPFKPTKTPLEEQLTGIWYKVLEIAPELKITIGIKDPFVYYGGDSIKMMALRTEINKVFNVGSFSLNEIGSLEEFTIEKLADILQKKLAFKKLDDRVELAKEGSDKLPPLFLLPPISGESTFTYGKLCKELKTQKKVYVLNSPLLINPSLPISNSISEMAECYVSLIRQIEPQGNICVAGWSSGGTIAYEVAYQMEKHGVNVDFVGIIDEIAPDIQASLSSSLFAKQLLKLVHYFAELHGFKVEVDEDFLSQFPKAIQVNKIFDTIQVTSESAKNILNHVKVFLLASLDYIQPKLKKVPITIFRTEPTAAELKLLNPDAVESLGWSKCSDLLVSNCELQGDHFSIMEHPEELARKMDFCILKMASSSKNQPELEISENAYARISKIVGEQIRLLWPSAYSPGLFSTSKIQEQEMKPDMSLPVRSKL